MKMTFDALLPFSYKFQTAKINFSKLKYFVILIFPLAALTAFIFSGLLTFLPAILFFGVVPLLELFLQPDHQNIENRTNDKFYDWYLFLLVPIQLVILVVFLCSVSAPNITTFDLIGRIISMGLMCGLLGITLGHELGHRVNRFEQFLGEVALLTSLENHFLPYHNLGHHRNAATPKDPATARRNETVYTFWFRSQFGSYVQAWQFEISKQKRNNRHWFSLRNRMVTYTIAQIVLISGIYYFFGLTAMCAFIASAIIGKLLLETVNYIEHYGLLRKIEASGKYERVKPEHSWNSDHVLGRAILLELSRHSDHHFRASKHYQSLDSISTSPQMPTGYPGMMLFSLIPPLWFAFMNRKLDEMSQNTERERRGKRPI
jgi:alkane 1-monooxygenase